MRYKKYINRIIIFIIIIVFAVLYNKTLYVKADVINDSESIVNITNSHGEIVATITMTNGNITVVAQSQTGTSDIKWASMGFTITRKPLKEISYTYRAQEGTYYLKGYENVSTVYDSGYGELMFSKAIKTSVTDKTTGITTATIKFTAKQVEEELSGEKFNDITKNTPIYLHAIFRTYVVKGTKETDIETNIKNWKDILLAKWWDRKDDKLEEFAKYYNMRIEFQPAKQENNTLYHYIDDINKPIETKHLISAKPEEIISWSDEPAEKSYKNKKYELYKYVVENKKGEVLETHFIGDSHSGKPSCNIENIRSGKAKVVFGGLKIKLYYKEKEGANILIRAVNQKTNTVIKNKLYEGYVIRGEDFNKEIDTVIEDNNKIYNKSINFSYEYKNNKNISKTKLFKTTEPGDPIKFTIPSDIQNSSTIIVTVYYNEKAPSPIPVTVKAIKKDTNDEIKTYTTNTVNGGEQYSFTAEDPIQIGSKKYEFTGDWKWQFKKSISSYPIITDYGNGPNISFKAPTADEIKDGITVYVYYREKDTKEDEINLRVIMVSRIGALIKEISTEKVTRGQDISKDIESIKAVNRFAYKYISKWDYTYTTASGDTTKSGSGGTASFKVSTNTKLGTVITLRLYYELEHKEEPLIEEQSISIDIDNPSPYARIDGDKYGANYFFSKDGISTTESQHVYVKAKDYLLGYTLVNRTGTVKFTVPVKMIYTLNFNSSTPKEHDGPIQVIDKVTDEQVIIVEKAYSYWEIEKLEYYIISSANVYNYSIPNGGVSLSAGTINVPNLITRHSSEPEDHIILPKEHYDGIELTYELPPAEERPQIEFQDLTAYALEMTGELKVKNDYLVFNGDTVLSDAISEKIAPYPITTSLVQSNRIIDDKILYTEGQIIDALKRNGVYQSNGNVTYTRHPMSVNADQNYKIFDMPVNHVTIHTPVICNPIIYSDNDKYVQLINPTEEVYHMVLDPDTSLNDFTVRISNTLPHSARLGFYERDFSRSFIDPENVSYIAKKNGMVRNEMKLPFDVYIDKQNDKNPVNDDFIKAGTWIILGRETHRFYVPMWVQEGIYKVQFRTVAVNGEDKLENTESTRNTSLYSYVATETKIFQISGRIYGLTIYDISDDTRWKDVFRIKDTMMLKYFEGLEDGTKQAKYNDNYAYYYTVGLNNRYGYQVGRSSRYTLPILNGSHPKYKNVGAIKTGYAFRFRLDTIGDMYASGCKVRIIPTFYHVDEKGENRQRVNIYYDEEFYNNQHYLVKIGEGIDLANIQNGLVGNPYSRIPEAELRHTAKVTNTTYAKIKNQYGPMYSYSDIRLTSQFRTFVGLDYAAHIAGLPSYTNVRTQTKETELSLSKYMQRWYGTYKLPTNIHVVPAGYDVYGHLRKYGIDYHEDFWLKDGYIIVNFNIETIDKNGNRNLSYINGSNYMNKGHCSMWVTEGGELEKSDNTGAAFSLRAGDVIFYYTSKKHSDDYMGRLW